MEYFNFRFHQRFDRFDAWWWWWELCGFFFSESSNYIMSPCCKQFFFYFYQNESDTTEIKNYNNQRMECKILTCIQPFTVLLIKCDRLCINLNSIEEPQIGGKYLKSVTRFCCFFSLVEVDGSRCDNYLEAVCICIQMEIFT